MNFLLKIRYRTFKKIFASSNLDFVTKLYLYENYFSNLAKIKRKNELNLWDKILKLNLDNQREKIKKKIEKKIEHSRINETKNLEQIQNPKNFSSPDLNVDLKKELIEIKQSIRKKQIEKLRNLIKFYLNKLNVKHLLDLKNSQNNMKNLFNFLSRNIEIYKRSIQELVEGQREVTQNKNFQFEDGETVQEKMDKFEMKLKENLNSGKEMREILKNKNKLI
jgi:hypothetical protein